MITKKLTAGVLCALVFVLSACKKEFSEVQSDSLNGEITSSDATANEVLETAPPVHKPVYYNVNSDVAGYWESLPARYNLTTKRYPLIVFIHGIGELGTSLSRINCCGLPYHLRTGTFPAKFLVNGVWHSFIVVSPQFKKRPTAAQVQSVVDYAKRKYRVDPARVYVTGLSMGGGSTWDYSAVYGQNAAAIVPVCGGTKPTTTLASQIASKSLPIWTISSSGDAVVPISWAKNWISWIDARNSAIAPKTKVTAWIYESHNATWARAFNPKTKVDGYNIYEWMLLFKRGTGTPAPIPSGGNRAPIASAGPDQSIPLSWKYFPTLNATRSNDPDGWIKSFRWTKISGPSSYSFSSITSAQPKVTNLIAGTYIFRVTVTDNKGATAIDDVKITMTGSGSTPTSPVTVNGNKVPVANAGSDQTIPKSWRYFPTLNATLSKDYDGWITRYRWTKISGPASYSLYNANASQTKTYSLVPGAYIFRVTVTDNKGLTDIDDVKITITNN